MSAPIDRQKPIWINPCRLQDMEYPTGESEITEFVPRPKDDELLTQIVLQAKTALAHAENFRDKYVETTFKMNLKDYHTAWRNNQYDWLPGSQEIPKGLGEKLDLGYLKTLQFEQALKDTYEYLQKYAVGLEQIFDDQNEHNGEFLEDFRTTMYNVRSTLCEIQVAMLERNVTQKPDITRDLMSSDYRIMNNSSDRMVRDWLIFRDYMNCLEYVIQVFDFIKERMSAAS